MDLTVYIYMRGIKVFRLILLNIDWHRNCHNLHASSLKFIICISFLSLPIFKLFSTHALSSVHSQQLTHCKNKNTQHDQKFNFFNYLFFFGGGGSKNSPLHHSNKKRNPPSHKSHLRGEFTPFLKMKLRTWMNVCKNPDWRITINKSTC